jgi:hypothetical protein
MESLQDSTKFYLEKKSFVEIIICLAKGSTKGGGFEKQIEIKSFLSVRLKISNLKKSRIKDKIIFLTQLKFFLSLNYDFLGVGKKKTFFASVEVFK